MLIPSLNDVLTELSTLAADLGHGEAEDYVRASLTRVGAASDEGGNMAGAADRLRRSLLLLERQRARGARRQERLGHARVARMLLLVDQRLRPLVGALSAGA